MLLETPAQVAEHGEVPCGVSVIALDRLLGEGEAAVEEGGPCGSVVFLGREITQGQRFEAPGGAGQGVASRGRQGSSEEDSGNGPCSPDGHVRQSFVG